MTINVAALKMTTGLTRNEALALIFLIRKVNIEKPWVADVGTWKGFSCAILGSEIKHRGGNIIAVDHWKGNVGTWNLKVVEVEDICSTFQHNMKVLGLDDIVHVFSMPSSQAVNCVQDGSFALVFLDADHRYQQFMEDLKNWYPKVKTGGILCGHDRERYYSQVTSTDRELIDSHLTEDFIDGFCHPGVVKGLYDFFHDDYLIVKDTRIWFKERR